MAGAHRTKFRFELVLIHFLRFQVPAGFFGFHGPPFWPNTRLITCLRQSPPSTMPHRARRPQPPGAPSGRSANDLDILEFLRRQPIHHLQVIDHFLDPSDALSRFFGCILRAVIKDVALEGHLGLTH